MTDSDNGITTSYIYDNLGRQVSATQGTSGLSRTTSTVYNDVARSVTVTQSDTQSSLTATAYYDPLGRLTESIDGAGNQVWKAYRYNNGNGNTSGLYVLTSNVFLAGNDPTMGWTVTVSDTTGRPVSTTHYAGQSLPSLWGANTASTGSSGAAYDQAVSGCSGVGTTLTDEAGNAHNNCTDGAGRLTSVTEPNPATGAAGTVTSYLYDVLDNLIAVDYTGEPAGGCTLPGSTTTHVRCFAYSTLPRLMSASNPESGTTSYAYDNNGNVTQRTDANQTVTAVSNYDGLGRPQSISYTLATNPTTAATPGICYTYDQDFKGASSSVTTLSSPSCPNGVSAAGASTTSYTHDGFGRITGSTQTTGSSVPRPFTYGYSLTDQLTSITYPSGRQIKYGLDGADRVTSVTNATTQANYATINYAANATISGVSTAMMMGNGTVQAFQFNDRSQPTGVQVTSGNNSLLSLGFYPCSGNATSCGSGNNGNLQSQTIALPGMSLTQTYSYDHLNRLTSASESGGGGSWSQSYGYDPMGNRWVAGNSGLPYLTQETPQSSNWYSATVPNRIATWSYDANGNVLGVGGMARSFTYDGENRQVAANINGAIGTYQYDGNGFRVSKTAGGSRRCTCMMPSATWPRSTRARSTPARAEPRRATSRRTTWGRHAC